MQPSKQRHVPYGIALVEALIGMSIGILTILMVSNVLFQYNFTGRNVTEKTQAIFLAEEGLELLRYVRDSSWTNIANLTQDTPYALSITPTDITIVNTPETIGTFARTFTVTPVYRDTGTDDVVASTTSGSVADADTQYVTVQVTWGDPQHTVTLATILANLNP